MQLRPLRVHVKTPIVGKLKLFGRMQGPRTERFVQDWFERNYLEASTVARRTLDGVRHNRALVVIGRDASSGYWTKRLAPGVLDRVMVRMTRSLTRVRATNP